MSECMLNNNSSQNAIFAALCSDYNSIYLVNLDKNTFTPCALSTTIQKEYGIFFNTNPTYDEAMNVYIERNVSSDYSASMKKATSREFLKKFLSEKSVYTKDFKGIRNGTYFYSRMKVVLMPDSKDGICCVIGFADVSYQKEEELERYAYSDPITQGNNYNYFKQAVRRLQKNGFFISMDIHSFKIINSVCGTKVGDQVLKEIYDETLQLTGNENIIARINGDHFALFIATEDNKKLEDLINNITIEMVKLSVRLQTPQLIPYFGITKWNPDKSIEMALNEANTAKHEIKHSTEINFDYYNEADAVRLKTEKLIEDKFEDALKKNKFEVWYQKKCDPENNAMIGAEALVRWRQEDGKMLSPASFIPIFEKNGMIRQLDEFVFSAVCRQQKLWLDAGHKIVPISINISRASLYFLDVVDVYRKITEKFGIEPKYVPIEITESATVDNNEIKEIVNGFHNAGFPLHMDDFGTGYSSLATLNMMHFDTLKLDKSLVDFIGNYGGDRLLDHTIALAKELGMHVTAEGVESKDQVDFLNNLNCDSIQGFYYSKPVPAEEFEKNLENVHIDNTDSPVVMTKRLKNMSGNIYLEAMEALAKNFHKILKINLTNDTYEIIKFYYAENDLDHGYSKSISQWLLNFADCGQVHPDDVENYKRMVNLEYMRNFFKAEKGSLRIRYRRKVQEEFRWVMMEMVPSIDFTKDNMFVMLYVQDLHEEFIPDLC